MTSEKVQQLAIIGRLRGLEQKLQQRAIKILGCLSKLPETVMLPNWLFCLFLCQNKKKIR